MRHFFLRLTALALVLLLLTGCAASTSAAGSEGTLSVTFLDVGKGDCILIAKDGTYILIDAGYDETREGVITALKKAGVDRLDHFIVTHYDKDHVGGAAAIAESFSIGQIWLPGYEGENEYYTALMNVISQKKLAAKTVTKDVSFTLADVSYTIYASEIEYVPASGKDEGNDNDASLVIAARWGSDSYLFAGDMEEEGVESWLAAGVGTFDVVKMPHHGRKESNTDDLIDSVLPKVAIITDSEDETADKKVIKTLTEAGAETYCSSKCGTIVVTSTGAGTYTVTTQKK